MTDVKSSKQEGPSFQPTWQESDPQDFDHYAWWVNALTEQGLHAKTDIALCLAMMSERIEILEADNTRLHKQWMDLKYPGHSSVETTDESVGCGNCDEAHRVLTAAGIADGDLAEKIDDLVSERDAALEALRRIRDQSAQNYADPEQEAYASRDIARKALDGSPVETPDEPTTCLGIIKSGICSCGHHGDGWKCLSCGHENPPRVLRCQNPKCPVLGYSSEKASGNSPVVGQAPPTIHKESCTAVIGTGMSCSCGALKAKAPRADCNDLPCMRCGRPVDEHVGVGMPCPQVNGSGEPR